VASLTDSAKRLIFGRKLRSDRLGQTLLPKRMGLPVFASDALSSNAYATQEILIVLSLGGFALFMFAPWVAAAVVVVFLVVIAAYRQNVRAYPSGGGDYEVVSVNLGRRAGAVVASALLVDYTLTVAVSIAAAVDNIASTWTDLAPYKVSMAVIAILGLTVMNLRGVRESGRAFAVPTYGFIVAVFTMFATAGYRLFRGDVMLAESAGWEIAAEQAWTGLALVLLVGRALASGTTALTGVEAISNGVPAFREPKSRNAASTLLLLGIISMTMFSGITYLAIRTGVRLAADDESLIGLPPGQTQKTVIAQIAQAVFSNAPFMAFLVTAMTALILLLAANSAYNGFPVLGSTLARDGYLPRQLHNRGDRLAFSNGIVTLSALAVVLILVYEAQVSRLIQLYIVGVFVAFTLSQLGMVRHWNRVLRTEEDRRRRGMAIRSRLVNIIGFAVTVSVLVIALVTKFIYGAWVVVVAIPAIYLLMTGIRRHYDRIARELSPGADETVLMPSRVHAVVLVSKLHKPALRALAYARATRPTTLEAITVAVDVEPTKALLQEWERRSVPVALRVLDSPYREITRPVVEYVNGLRRRSPRDLVTIYIPEYVVGHWWEHLLHNQSALRLKARLLFTSGVMVVSVPWQLVSSERAAARIEHSAPGAVRRGEPPNSMADRSVREHMDPMAPRD
jgi:amino acid transporter